MFLRRVALPVAADPVPSGSIWLLYEYVSPWSYVRCLPTYHVVYGAEGKTGFSMPLHSLRWLVSSRVPAVSLNTITSAGAFPTCRSFHFFRALLCLWCCPVRDRNAPSLRIVKKSPAYAVQIHLIPGHNQVGAIVESLGFPVVPGHAHPFPGTAPIIFFYEEQAIPVTGKAGDLFMSKIYIPKTEKNGKDKITRCFTKNRTGKVCSMGMRSTACSFVFMTLNCPVVLKTISPTRYRHPP